MRLILIDPTGLGRYDKIKKKARHIIVKFARYSAAGRVF